MSPELNKMCNKNTAVADLIERFDCVQIGEQFVPRKLHIKKEEVYRKGRKFRPGWTLAGLIPPKPGQFL